MVPEDFVRRTVAAYGERGREWLRALPETVEWLSERWGLVVEAPFPGLTYNYVLPATDRDGDRLVLKIGIGSPEGDREPVAMRAYAGGGAARLVRYDEPRRAMLLRRVDPGGDLREISDPEAVGIAAGVMKILWAAAPPEGFPELEEWTRSIERFREDPGPIPVDLLERALRLRRDLLQSPPERVLLHGDLHHANLLRSDQEGWLAIDPKGVVGEKAYDLVAFPLNPGPVGPERTRVRVDDFVERLGLDRERVAAWALVQAVVSACWTVEEGGELWEGALDFAEGIGSWV